MKVRKGAKLYGEQPGVAGANFDNYELQIATLRLDWRSPDYKKDYNEHKEHNDFYLNTISFLQ